MGGRGSSRRAVLLLLAALTFSLPVARGQEAPGRGSPGRPVDPLDSFLRGLSDSTEVIFGHAAVAFDTVGIDSTLRAGGLPGGVRGRGGRRSGGAGLSYSPSFAFHRATGAVTGLAMEAGPFAGCGLSGRVAYGWADREGRYRVGISRTVYEQRSGANRIVLAGDYARETVSFATEHTQRLASTLRALTTGRDRQSVYERRGGTVELRWSHRYGSVLGGFRAARDQSMSTRTSFSLWGGRSSVAPNARATAGSYREGFARTSLLLTRLGSFGLDGRYAARDRWRLRAGAARTQVLGGFEAHLQLEAGEAAGRGPSQLLFQLGGPLAVPSLDYGAEAGNRLLLGKLELIHGLDLLRSLHVPHPTYVIFHPGLFLHQGAAWTSVDGRWNVPRSGDWRGTAGFELVNLPGIPSLETYIRLQIGWPLGPDSGKTRLTLTLGRWRDVVGD